MADKSFDVVLVGGGNKGLIAAMYLAKYGKMRVGIFDDRHELGGGWAAEETVPGFIGNTCSMYHVAGYHTPVFWDFPEWEDYGARYTYTEVGGGCVFIDDDTCLLSYVGFDDVDPHREKTAAGIARFSQKDADTYLNLWDKYVRYWEPAFQEWNFTPAKPFGEPDAIERLIQNPEAGIDPAWIMMPQYKLFMDIFEDPHLQIGFARLNQSLGLPVDTPGFGLTALILTFYFWGRGCHVIGGSHALAHASQKVILENGGKVYTNATVEKILIDNGKARGIRLSDGTEIEAGKAVVTSVDPHQLCLELIGREHLDSKLIRRVESIDRDWINISYFSWVFKDLPRYKSEDWNPDVGKTMWLSLGSLGTKDLFEENSERRLYQWPSSVNMAVGYKGPTNGRKDPQLFGPPGKDYTLITEQFTVPAWTMTEKEWMEKRDQHADDIIRTWQKYAPNVTWDNLIEYLPVDPYYSSTMCKNYGPAGNWGIIDNCPHQMGRMRPTPEMAGNRVPGVEGLYATGSGWHPWASAHSFQGYNCYKVMADDLGLEKPWEEDGRPF